MTRRFRPGLTPTVLSLVSLVVLIALGNWQLERLVWKQDLLATIAERMAAPPVTLPALVDDAEPWRYRRVTTAGVFAHHKERHLFATDQHGGGGGYYIFTPLIRPQAPPVFVNRGWVPADRKDAADRLSGQTDGLVTVVGLVRLTRQRGPFMPDNDPAGNQWFYPDLSAMAASVELDAAPPLFVEADRDAEPARLPRGGQTRLDIPNNHLAYALTWFGLAVVLVGVYTAYGFSRGRRAAPDGRDGRDGSDDRADRSAGHNL